MIGTLVKSFILSVVALAMPYLIKAAVAVAAPLGLKSLQAALNGDPAETAKAKAEVKANWKKYVSDAQAMASGTPTKIDDAIFATLAITEIDDEFVGKIFDLAVKAEEQFFRPAVK